MGNNSLFEKNDTKKLDKYCNDFRNNKEFSFRIFDDDKTLLFSSKSDYKSKIKTNDKRLLKTKENIWKIYRHSLKDRSLEKVSEFKINNKNYFLEISLSEEFIIKSILKAQEKIIIFFAVCLLLLILSLVYIFIP